MAEAIEWRPSSVAIFTEGASHPFTTPLDLLRFSPLPLHSRLRMGLGGAAAAAPAGRRRAVRGHDRARVDRRRDGPQAVGRRLGSAVAGKVRRPRRADLDGLALEQADAEAATRGPRGREGAARLPEWRLAAAAGAAARRDRPRRTAACSRTGRLVRSPATAGGSIAVRRGCAGLVSPRSRPAALRALGRSGKLRRRARHLAKRRLRRPARRRSARRGRSRLSRARSSRSNITPRSACCSSSTAVSATSTGPTSPIPRCRSSA